MSLQFPSISQARDSLVAPVENTKAALSGGMTSYT